MSDRTDHAAIALDCLGAVDRIGYSADSGYEKQELLAAAQVHARLAQVEQQRLANLLTTLRDAHSARLESSLWQQIKEGLGL